MFVTTTPLTLSLVSVLSMLVSAILGALGGGDSTEDVLTDYPNITLEDIQAALSFGGELSRFEEGPYEAAS